jgi:queuine/archaeosine tRNA-ribosyltransferase
MSDRKEFLYIPSLSAGSMVSAFKKDTKFEDGTTMRFFAKEYPEKWRHPHFLVTAGHHYKKMDFRDQLGLDDGTFVFGDSGGFQIATGALKWDGTIREKIFHWLEANSDVAANLDIPPRVTFENRFQDAMDISFDNFKYFEKNQSGKTKFLNVIQGTFSEEYKEWYHKFKDFDFKGWCIGGPKKLVDFMYVIALMLQEREFEKKHIEYIHLLGISKISDFFILATLQELLNKMTDNRIQLMSDSSSPGQYPVFGTYLHSGNYKTQTFTELYFPKNAEYRRKTHIKQGKGGEITIDKTKHVPCSMGCPACNDFTYEYLGGKTDAGLDRYSQEGMPRMVVHNTHLYCEIVKDINKLTNNHVELLETAIPKELFNVILSLHEMFGNPDNAMNVYSAYKKTYKKFGGESISTTDVKQFNKFFKF